MRIVLHITTGPLTEVTDISAGSLFGVERALRRVLIASALRSCDGNRTRAAEQMGIERSGLLMRMKQLGLQDYGRKSGRPRSEDEA